jgi:hypothetical protein
MDKLVRVEHQLHVLANLDDPGGFSRDQHEVWLLEAIEGVEFGLGLHA